MRRQHLIAFTAALAFAASLPALAENSTKADGYTIHHNAFSADTLNPEVAKAYGLQRSKYRGLLNVTVIKDEPGTIGIPQPAAVDVDIVTLSGQKSRIPMRQLGDQKAIYYIGEFPVYDQQTINFEIRVKPQGAESTHTMKMSQQFFTD